MNRSAHIVLPILLISCLVLSAKDKVTVTTLVGEFRSGDAFWPTILELREDQTFDYYQITDQFTLLENGDMIQEGGWHVIGTWKFTEPDSLHLHIEGNEERIEMMALPHTKYGVIILEDRKFEAHDISKDPYEGRYLAKENKTEQDGHPDKQDPKP